MLQSSRRRVLATIAAGGLAGCLDSGGSDGATRLGEVTIENGDDARHVVHVRLTWEGELIQERSYEIDANDPADDLAPGAVPARTWPSEPGQFEFEARVEGGNWDSFDPADRGYPDCVALVARIDREGDLTIWESTDPALCGE